MEPMNAPQPKKPNAATSWRFGTKALRWALWLGGLQIIATLPLAKPQLEAEAVPLHLALAGFLAAFLLCRESEAPAGALIWALTALCGLLSIALLQLGRKGHETTTWVVLGWSVILSGAVLVARVWPPRRESEERKSL